MNIKIRKATLKDIDTIVNLNKRLMDYHRDFDKYYRPSSETRRMYKLHIKKILHKRGIKILVAEKDDKIIGYIMASMIKTKPYLSPKRIGKISDAFVIDEYRKKGVGKKMLNEIIDWFKKNNIKYIELSVDSRNKIGIKAWKKYGFKEYVKKMRLDL